MAEKLGIQPLTISRMAKKLGLVRTPEEEAQLRASQPCSQFKKGVQHNRQQKENYFKRGNNPPASCEIGTERVHKDKAGTPYIQVKVKRGPGSWRLKHHLVWLEAHGAILPGHVIAFRDGDTLNPALENLEQVTRAEILRRNRRPASTRPAPKISYHPAAPKINAQELAAHKAQRRKGINDRRQLRRQAEKAADPKYQAKLAQVAANKKAKQERAERYRAAVAAADARREAKKKNQAQREAKRLAKEARPRKQPGRPRTAVQVSPEDRKRLALERRQQRQEAAALAKQQEKEAKRQAKETRRQEKLAAAEALKAPVAKAAQFAEDPDAIVAAELARLDSAERLPNLRAQKAKRARENAPTGPSYVERLKAMSHQERIRHQRERTAGMVAVYLDNKTVVYRRPERLNS